MKRPLTAISTLVRWQAFKESLALNELRCRNDETRQAAERAEAAKAADEQAMRARSASLNAFVLDLGRIEAIAEIESAARSQREALSVEHAAAVQRRDAAQAAHAEERTRTRATDERLRKKSIALHDQLEKQSFDRIADTYLQMKWRQRHG